MSHNVRKTILRTLIFAGALVTASLAIDVLFAVVYQGGPGRARVKEFLVFRAALHGATFVFTAIGAAAGFALLRSYSISNARIAMLGAASGLVTLFGVLLGVHVGGFRGIVLGLVVGSAVVTYLGGRLLGSRDAGSRGFP